ncbi:MAG: type II toxin-antitoxin system VapC family toxin [Deltaproteobacteria bacterium]|nr:MAG: type II toxin-antitoxin system VapC family toxin [Deltaproteobacteria bacterium]
MRFWDTSALVPLLVTQGTSPQTDEWLAEDGDIAVWTLTAIELTSALMLLAREGAIRERDAHETEVRIDELLRSCHTIVDVEAVKSQARRLLRVHPLRAADALQLGAAWEWAAGRPANRIVHTLDARLAVAARREGFRVIPD